MAYIAPYIDAAGLHIPTYPDILAELVAKVQAIYGADIYLTNDSADYQMLSVFALKIFDSMQSIQLAYNSRSPATAIGAALDALVLYNGMVRKSSSYSTCQVLITGTGGTIINNGVIADLAGYKWNLDPIVTIGDGGTVTTSATCQTIGEITASQYSLTNIQTPTSGWTLVTNEVAAVPGLPVETDSLLRIRQALSTELPSLTELEGTMGAIAIVPGVTRYKVYENPTGATGTDPNGYDLPAHSITCVVEGGSDNAVGQAIYENRGLGCKTNGTTTVDFTDTYGIVTPISFYRPSYVPIFIDITVKKLTGYSTAVGTAIIAALVTYLNSLAIGEELTISALYGAALSVLPDLTRPTFSIITLTAGLSGESDEGTTDIEIDFDEVISGVTEDVVLIET